MKTENNYIDIDDDLSRVLSHVQYNSTYVWK